MSPISARSPPTCSTCRASFSRPEHLRRHMTCHEETERYQCDHCKKTFTRPDVLQRHTRAHLDAASSGRRDASGAFRACNGCAKARTRCSGGATCSRCNVKGIECKYPEKRRSKRSSVDRERLLHEPPLTEDDLSLGIATTPSVMIQPPGASPLSTSVFGTAVGQETYESQQSQTEAYAAAAPTNTPWRLTSNPAGQRNHEVSSDHQPGLLPQNIEEHQLQQDDEQMTDLADIFNSNYMDLSFMAPMNWLPLSSYQTPAYLCDEQPTIISYNDGANEDLRELQINNAGNRFPQVPLPSPPPSTGTSLHSPGSLYVDGLGSRATHRRKSTKRTVLRMSYPYTVRQDGFHRDAFSFPSIEMTRTSNTADRQYIDNEEYLELRRQSFFLTVELSTFFAPFLSDTFPARDVINELVALYFDTMHTEFPIIHKPSYLCNPKPWILNLALAACGCLSTAMDDGGRCFEAFQELLRRALMICNESMASVDETTLVQAELLNYLGLLKTTNKFLLSKARVTHASLVMKCCVDRLLVASESMIDPGLPVQERWKKWLLYETRRRLGYCIWLVDATTDMLTGDSSKLSSDTGETKLPCNDLAWHAESAEQWDVLMNNDRTPFSLNEEIDILYRQKRTPQSSSRIYLTLLIFGICSKTREIGDGLQKPLAMWEPSARIEEDDVLTSGDHLWLPSNETYSRWRNCGCDCLDVLHWQANSITATASGLESPVVLHLHLARILILTPFRVIQDFVEEGILSNQVNTGNLLATTRALKKDSSYRLIWLWLTKDQHKARLSLIHAGGILWHVRRYSIGGYYESVATFLAILVLWTYGFFTPAILVGNEKLSEENRHPQNAHQGMGNDEVDNLLDNDPQDRDSDFGCPESILVDRLCDDEIVQLFVRRGDTMKVGLTSVPDIASRNGPRRILNLGVKLLSVRNPVWGITARYHDTLKALVDKMPE